MNAVYNAFPKSMIQQAYYVCNDGARVTCLKLCLNELHHGVRQIGEYLVGKHISRVRFSIDIFVFWSDYQMKVYADQYIILLLLLNQR